MRPLTNNSLLLMEKAMSGLWTRQAAILENIAHVETPNYKAKYVTFEDALRSRLEHASGSRKPRAAVREAIESSGPAIHTAQESTRMDGNGVNPTEQQVELARTGIQLEYVMQAINSDIAGLRSAIKGQ